MAANSYKSSPLYSSSPQIPWLMHPTNKIDDDNEEDNDDDIDSRCFLGFTNNEDFLNFKNKKVYKVKNMFERFDN